MSIDLEWDEDQLAVIDALKHFCRDHRSDEVARSPSDAFPTELWRGLAELGVLAIGTPEGDGGPREIAAVMVALGDAVFPGPLVASFFATHVLPLEERCAVAHGTAVVALGTPPLLPWAPHAGLFIELEGELAWLARSCGPEPAAVEQTLGGEPWGRVVLERVRPLEGVALAHQVSQMALAAYLVGAGQRLVSDAAEHARTRKQFGRAIGEFQAVAHPLADCHTRLSAASTLARAASCELAVGGARAAALAAAARLSASAAALDAVHVSHQVFGAIGITLEGPVFHVSRRIRQLVSFPPGDAPAREALLDYFGVMQRTDPSAASGEAQHARAGE